MYILKLYTNIVAKYTKFYIRAKLAGDKFFNTDTLIGKYKHYVVKYMLHVQYFLL